MTTAEEIKERCEVEGDVSIACFESDKVLSYYVVGKMEVFVFEDGSSIELHPNGNFEACKP